MPTRAQSSNRISITPEMLARLREQAARTSTGAARLLRNARDKPIGLSSNVIETWLSGCVVTARPEHLAYALARWSALPDKRRAPLTAGMIAALNAELNRTALGPDILMRKLKHRPPGLTRQVIQSWAHGTVNTVDDTEWNDLIAKLADMPDGRPGAWSGLPGRLTRREITDDEISELRAHRERTGFGGAILLRNAEDIPPGLTPAMISNWLSGNAKTAHPDHIAYVLARYRAWQ